MSMKPVKTEHLIKVLERIGFASAQRSESRAIFSHEKTGAVISIPIDRDEVPAIYLASVQGQVRNFGILSEEKLAKMLYAPDPAYPRPKKIAEPAMPQGHR